MTWAPVLGLHISTDSGLSILRTRSVNGPVAFTIALVLTCTSVRDRMSRVCYTARVLLCKCVTLYVCHATSMCYTTCVITYTTRVLHVYYNTRVSSYTYVTLHMHNATYVNRFSSNNISDNRTTYFSIVIVLNFF